MKFPYTLTDRSVSVLVAGRLYQTDRSNANWPALKAALSDPTTTEEQLVGLICPIAAVTNATCEVPEIEVRGGSVWFGNEVIHSSLATRILDIVREGLPVEPWVEFAKKVYANPSIDARTEFYDWFERCELPLCPDGDFIAYKGVTDDYKDNYSRKFDNHVGQVVTMPGGRESCDANRDRDCSAGLHFCSRQYLPFATRLMLVKISPTDVVSFPRGESGKGRTWRYEVVGEVDPAEALVRTWSPVVTPSTGYTDYSYDPDPDPDDEDDDFIDWAIDKFDGGDQLVVVTTSDPVSGYTWAPLADPDPELERLLAEEAEIESGVLTERQGLVTLSVFQGWQARWGKSSKIAEAIGENKGTVRRWKKKLGA